MAYKSGAWEFSYLGARPTTPCNSPSDINMSFEGYSGDHETVMSGIMSPSMTTPTSTAFGDLGNSFLG